MDILAQLSGESIQTVGVIGLFLAVLGKGGYEIHRARKNGNGVHLCKADMDRLRDSIDRLADGVTGFNAVANGQLKSFEKLIEDRRVAEIGIFERMEKLGQRLASAETAIALMNGQRKDGKQ